VIFAGKDTGISRVLPNNRIGPMTTDVVESVVVAFESPGGDKLIVRNFKLEPAANIAQAYLVGF
jgi:hypothetical protein